MDHKISNEQKAHDLAIAYTTYTLSKSDCIVDIEAFYQDYVGSYTAILPLIKRYD